MDKDMLYRMRHPDRVKQSAKACYEKHREANLLKKKERYQKMKMVISEEGKKDRVECPYCQGVTYRRLYLKKHLKTRHPNLCQKIDDVKSPQDFISVI